VSRPAHIHSGGEAVISTSGGLKMLCIGETVPTDGVAGYVTGCLFIKTNGGDGTSIYVNEGTIASCDFNALIVA